MKQDFISIDRLAFFVNISILLGVSQNYCAQQYVVKNRLNMLIYTSNTQQQGHTDSAISQIFSLSCYRSLPFATASKEGHNDGAISLIFPCIICVC